MIVVPGLIVLVDNSGDNFPRNRELIHDMAGLISHESFYRSSFAEYPELGLHVCSVYLDHQEDCGMIGQADDGAIACHLNGELVDLDSLRHRLPDGGAGLRDRTSSSEIVAHLYRQIGEEAIHLLNGCFGLLIVDQCRNSILVANDRFGMHRFYHSRLADGAMMFAPEVKCFKLVPGINLNLNTRAIVESFRHDCILGNRSFYQEVNRFPIATVFRSQGGRWSSTQYWNPEPQLSEPKIPPEEFVETAIVVFESVVPDYHTPQQTALSFTGGLDTRAILSVLTRRGEILPLFTFGGMLRDSHDVKIARKLARRSGNSWKLIELGRDFLGQFERWADKAIWISDGIARLNTCHEYYLNLAARKLADIRLTGKYGSQVIRGVRLLKDRSPKPAIFSDDFNRLYQDTASDLVGESRAVLLREELPQLEGARHTQEAAALTVRTPYMDNRVIDVMLRAPEITDSSLLQKMICRRNAPALCDLPTNRGETVGVSRAAGLTRLYYRSLNFIDSVYNWEKLPRLALPVCRLGDITGLSRLFVGRHEWIHHRVWFTRELKDFARELILDHRTRNRPYYNGGALERMMRDHFSCRANFTPEIIKIGSFELWCRQNES